MITAADGGKALDILIRDAAVSAMITDVGLPGTLNGRQLADAARQLRPGLPVLFITGYAAGALDGELPVGMRVLAKPFDTSELGERLQSLLNT